jgi:hypothetical protein
MEAEAEYAMGRSRDRCTLTASVEHLVSLTHHFIINLGVEANDMMELRN